MAEQYEYDPFKFTWGCLACKGDPGPDCKPVRDSQLTEAARRRFTTSGSRGRHLGRDGVVGLCARHRGKFLVS